jgi:histone acetyltransferase (RNA polymerase elongator complex component)
MSLRPAPFIIPIFIAHQGCPHRCLFCNQRSITGVVSGEIGPEEVAESIRGQLAWPRRQPAAPAQVAFYGGSFTSLGQERQQELLAAVRPFLATGQVRDIRISARPDAMSPAIAAFLRSQGVAMVELGAQSLVDAVLAASGRGHRAGQVAESVACLRRQGLGVGLQLMLGLPGDTTCRSLTSARRAAALAPDLVRLYPCLVIAGSPLAALYRQGRFQPLSLLAAVALAGRMWRIFSAEGIPVARMGLQPTPSLARSFLAGPHHPAFGELVLSRLLFRKVRAALAARPPGRGPWRLSLARTDESIFRGRGNGSVRRLADLGLLTGVTVEFSPEQPRQSVLLRQED